MASFLKTRYCNDTCQHDHWRRGHKQICKKIHRGGNAEQYHADKKYKEAVAVAVEKCADDTIGCTYVSGEDVVDTSIRLAIILGTIGFTGTLTYVMTTYLETGKIKNIGNK